MFLQTVRRMDILMFLMDRQTLGSIKIYLSLSDLNFICFHKKCRCSCKIDYILHTKYLGHALKEKVLLTIDLDTLNLKPQISPKGRRSCKVLTYHVSITLIYNKQTKIFFYEMLNNLFLASLTLTFSTKNSI